MKLTDREQLITKLENAQKQDVIDIGTTVEEYELEYGLLWDFTKMTDTELIEMKHYYFDLDN